MARAVARARKPLARRALEARKAAAAPARAVAAALIRTLGLHVETRGRGSRRMRARNGHGQRAQRPRLGAGAHTALAGGALEAVEAIAAASAAQAVATTEARASRAAAAAAAAATAAAAAAATTARARQRRAIDGRRAGLGNDLNRHVAWPHQRHNASGLAQAAADLATRRIKGTAGCRAPLLPAQLWRRSVPQAGCKQHASSARRRVANAETHAQRL